MQQSLTFVTSNKAKAEQVSRYLHLPVVHQKVELTEIQSLDIEKVVTHKVNEAYRQLNTPVLVDDNALVITAMGKLPGTFIKFFEQELGYEGLCRLADMSEDRHAQALVTIGFGDGIQTATFTGTLEGTIADHPRGKGGFGWDSIFIPKGYTQTRAEMDDDDYDATLPRKFALEKLNTFLDNK
jgi:non-canonical purine NTP pyrophosphatase (RdgB/HAM1 family)